PPLDPAGMPLPAALPHRGGSLPRGAPDAARARAGPPRRVSPGDVSEDDARRRAAELWQEGCRLQMAGELDRAIEVYKRSIEVHPPAEAHTYLGWTYSFQGKLDEATAGRRPAIQVGPGFGTR